MLWRIADLLERQADMFAHVETLDNGKPLPLARDDDLPASINHFRYFAGLAPRIDGETIPVSAGPEHYLNYTLREPVGVIAQIIPWNYPLMLASWKLAPALACGNTCVLKPAEQTPLTALLLARLLQEAEVPPGVVNILTGRGEPTGALLAAHPDVDGVSFTGSTEIGRSITRASAGNLKRVTLELGGKSPNIVFADANLSDAIPGAARGIFYNMGQDCAAGSRVFAEGSVYRDVVDGLADEARKLRLGNGLEPNVDQGPLVSQEQVDKVLRYLDEGKREGAKIAIGGGRPQEPTLGDGFFVEPTVFASATNDMEISRDEIFGPVVAVIPFEGFEDGVLQSNATRYGLGAGVWTRDVKKAHGAAHALRAGTVWINCYNVYDPASPFGGYKESGVGRETGDYVVDCYTEVKSVWVQMD
jgi:acyl-CoA reductase-like NAD-dependent aldehyde dehydrogenase